MFGIKWHVLPKAGPDGGYIIQHVTTSPNLGWNYYEAWRVMPNSQIPTKYPIAKTNAAKAKQRAFARIDREIAALGAVADNPLLSQYFDQRKTQATNASDIIANVDDVYSALLPQADVLMGATVSITGTAFYADGARLNSIFKPGGDPHAGGLPSVNYPDNMAKINEWLKGLKSVSESIPHTIEATWEAGDPPRLTPNSNQNEIQSFIDETDKTIPVVDTDP